MARIRVGDRVRVETDKVSEAGRVEWLGREPPIDVKPTLPPVNVDRFGVRLDGGGFVEARGEGWQIFPEER